MSDALRHPYQTGQSIGDIRRFDAQLVVNDPGISHLKREFFLKSSSQSCSSARCRVDLPAWVDEFGDRLFRHALLRVGDRALAEDLVQETFLAAHRGKESFRGDASPLTWLTTILRNKIADHFRRSSTNTKQWSADASLERDDVDFSCGAEPWDLDPSRIVEDREFWTVFHQCVQSLPPILAEAYVLRDIEKTPAKEVCEVLGISPTNLSMRVKRARLAMRDLLQKNWFGTNRDGDRP